ncbi:hypothetical protein AALB16_04030 [Lachnospiraceae bacterium 62-35]
MRMNDLSFRDKRKKPWRKIRTGAEDSIRKICLCALILETAWGIQAYGGRMASREYRRTETVVTEEKTAFESRDEEFGRRTEICGVSIEWKDGTIRIYRQEEYWKEEER